MPKNLAQDEVLGTKQKTREAPEGRLRLAAAQPLVQSYCVIRPAQPPPGANLIFTLVRRLICVLVIL